MAAKAPLTAAPTTRMSAARRAEPSARSLAGPRSASAATTRTRLSSPPWSASPLTSRHSWPRVHSAGVAASAAAAPAGASSSASVTGMTT